MIKSILGNSFILLLGTAIGRVSVFISNVFAARILSIDTFGQYMLLRNTVNVLERLVSISLGNITIREISKDLSDEKGFFESTLAVFTINLIIGCVSSFFLLIFAENISLTFFLGERNLTQGLYISCFLLILLLLSSSAQKVLISANIYRGIIKISILNLLISVPISYFLISHYGFYGAIYSSIFYFLLDFSLKTLLLASNFSFRFFRPGCFNLRYYLHCGVSFIKKSKTLFLSAAIISFTFWYIRVIAVNIEGDFHGNAIFDASYQWYTIIMLITGATTSVGLQTMAKHQKDGIKSVFSINLKVNLAISLLLSIIIASLAKPIMSIYGPEYTNHFYILWYICIISTIASISSILDKFLIVRHYETAIFLSRVIAAIISIGVMRYYDTDNIATRMCLAYIAFYLCEILLFTIPCVKLLRRGGLVA